MRSAKTLGALAGLCAACTFQPSLNLGDGARSDAPNPDATPCDLNLVVNANGTPLSRDATEPPVNVLVADTVNLGTTGLCLGAAVQWSASPNTTISSFSPSPNAQSVAFYPLAAGDFTITLAIDPGQGRAIITFTALAVRVVGFTAITQWPGAPAANDIRDFAIGGGRLWAATDAGLVGMSLTDFADQVDNSTFTSGPDPTNLSAVWFETALGRPWVGAANSLDDVWRVDLGGGGNVIPANIAAALGGSSAVRDISAANTGGVWVATSKGAAHLAADGTLAGSVLVNPDLYAVAHGPTRDFAGGTQLWDLLDSLYAHNPILVGDNKVRGLLMGGDALWAMGEEGIALVNPPYSATAQMWRSVGKVRAGAIETAGDVWFASDAGILRYKPNFGGAPVMVPLPLSGIPDNANNLWAVAVDQGNGRRVVFAGGDKGIFVLRLPP